MVTFPHPPRSSLSREDQSASAAPAQFGPFRVLHQIGVGALGPVFRTYEPAGDRLVAVKAFRLDVTPETAGLLAAELSRAADAGLFHPSIVEPLAAGVEGAIAYAAEEYVAAESLDVALRQYAPASIETVLPFITQLSGAIDFARAAGVGHGALHPRDIFMTEQEARATGFGVVEALERAGLRAPVRRPYTAPERIDGRPWGTPADVFSLAAITYELLTGRRPSGLGAEIAPLTAGTPNTWMEALHGVLARAMQADPDARFQTALAFASALEAAARGAEARPPAAPSAAAPARNAAAAPAAPLVEADHLSSSLSSGAAGVRTLADDEERDDIRFEREDDMAHGGLLLDASRNDPSPVDWPLGGETPLAADPGRAALSLPLGAAVAALDDAYARRGAAAEPGGWAGGEDAPDPALQAPLDDEPARRAVVTPRLGAAQGGGSLYRPSVPPEPRRSRSHAAVLALVLLGLAGGLAAGYALWGSPFGRPADGTAAPSSSAADGADEQGPAANGAPLAGSAPAQGAEAGSGVEAPPAPDAPPSPAPARGTAAAPAGVAAPGPSADVAPPGARPSAGSLAIRSTPRGAGVVLNGRWRGRTPLVLEGLPFARYTVRVIHSGYAAATERVALDVGDPARSLSFQLRRASRAAQPAAGRAAARGAASSQSYSGAIYVDSRPRGARVSLDGKPVGVTPLRLPEVPIGSHVIRLELPDHRIWSSAATVTANEEVRVTGSLTPIP